MEEQKKKYLLSRIKKEQLIIQTQFRQYRGLYQGQTISQERVEPYLEHISHLVELNNTFASELIQYLDPPQVKGVFERFNTIFNDIFGKYKKMQAELRFEEHNKFTKDSKKICQICHEEIQNRRIENIKQNVDKESETRAVMIKSLIEETEKERVRPVFTEDEDRIFKLELDKALKQKEIFLQMKIKENSKFLEDVTQEMTKLMVDLREDFGDFGEEAVEEGINWTKMMKNYVNKKLANSFQDKIPDWIKKMHDLFLESQPVKPKVYYCNKPIQTDIYISNEELRLKHEVDTLKLSQIEKNKEIKQVEKECELLKQQIQQMKVKLHDAYYDLNQKEKQNLKLSKENDEYLVKERISKKKKTERIPEKEEKKVEKQIEPQISVDKVVRSKKKQNTIISSMIRESTSSIRTSNMGAPEVESHFKVIVQQQKKDEDSERIYRKAKTPQKKHQLKMDNYSNLHSNPVPKSKQQINQCNASPEPKIEPQSPSPIDQSNITSTNKTEKLKSSKKAQPEGKKLKKVVYNRLAQDEQQQQKSSKSIKTILKKSQKQQKQPSKKTLQSPSQKEQMKQVNGLKKSEKEQMKHSKEQKKSQKKDEETPRHKREKTSFSQNTELQEYQKLNLNKYISQQAATSNSLISECNEFQQTSRVEILDSSQIGIQTEPMASLTSEDKILLDKIKKNPILNQLINKLQDKGQNLSKSLPPINPALYQQKHESVLSHLTPSDSRSTLHHPSQQSYLNSLNSLNSYSPPKHKLEHKKSNFKTQPHQTSQRQARILRSLNNSDFQIDSSDGKKQSLISYHNPIMSEHSSSSFLPKIPSAHREILIHNQLKPKNSKFIQRKEKSKKKIPKTPRFQPNKILSGVGSQLHMLFLADNFAEKYEESFDEIANRKETMKPTPIQLDEVKQMYAELEGVKQNDESLYYQICAFMRFPFSQSKNNFLSATIVGDLNFQTFVNYFLKILYIHKQCPINPTTRFCQHIDDFNSKLKTIKDKKSTQ